MCRKFFVAQNLFKTEQTPHTLAARPGVPQAHPLVLSCARLYQLPGEEDEPDDAGPTTIRLPPVLSLHATWGGWAALTARGVFTWGANRYGELGLGTTEPLVDHPRRVDVSGVTEVFTAPDTLLLRTTTGWLASGNNFMGQLGISPSGVTDLATTPTPVAHSGSVRHWHMEWNSTFAWTNQGLMACGWNTDGQCGVGSTSNVSTLTPVALPDNVKGRVDRVLCSAMSTIMFSGRRCFVCGKNGNRQLGLDDTAPFKVTVPVELPFPVDNAIIHSNTTAFRTGTTVRLCGANAAKLPGPVSRVVLDVFSVSIRTMEGRWMQRNEWQWVDAGVRRDALEEMEPGQQVMWVPGEGLPVLE